MDSRRCAGHKADGSPCRAAPLLDRRHCRFHDPDSADAVAEGRRLGGQRRRKECVVAGAYDFNGPLTPESLGRLLEIAAMDTLSMDNSPTRNRLLISLAHAALRHYEVTELEHRLDALLRLTPSERYQ